MYLINYITHTTKSPKKRKVFNLKEAKNEKKVKIVLKSGQKSKIILEEIEKKC